MRNSRTSILRAPAFSGFGEACRVDVFGAEDKAAPGTQAPREGLKGGVVFFRGWVAIRVIMFNVGDDDEIWIQPRNMWSYSSASTTK